MDKRLQIVQRLYGEDDADRSAHPAGSSETEEQLNREYKVMSQVKFWLDHRSRVRPDAKVIDRIVQAAAAPAGTGLAKGARADRAPMRLLRVTPGRLAAVAAVVVVAIGIGLWRTGLAPDRPDAPAELADKPSVMAFEEGADERLAQRKATVGAEREEEPVVQSEALATELDELVDRDEVATLGQRDSAILVGAARKNADAPVADAIRVPDWDQSEEVAQLRQRLQNLSDRQEGLSWDKPVVPLEMMPEARSDANVHRARSRQR